MNALTNVQPDLFAGLFPANDNGVLRVLRTHQEEMRDFLIQNPRALLNAEAGYQKSSALLAAAQQVRGGQPVIIGMPKSALASWKLEFLATLGNLASFQKVQNGKTKLDGSDYYFVPYSMFRNPAIHQQLKRLEKPLLILDEAQNCKTPNAQQTKNVWGENGIHKNASHIWVSTGDLIKNDFSEAFCFFRACFPDTIRKPNGYLMNEHEFKHKYCVMEQMVHLPGQPWKVVRTNQVAAQALMNKIKPHWYKGLKRDVLTELPDAVFSEVAVDPDPDSLDFQAITADKELVKHVVDAAINGKTYRQDHIKRLQMAAEMAKVRSTIALISSELRDEKYKKIVLWTNFRSCVDALKEGLSEFNPVVIDGRSTNAAREQAIHSFTHNPTCRVFIGNIKAANTAITLHANNTCKDVAFLGGDWVPANNSQAVARVHRGGQTNVVRARFMYVPDTIDEDITRTLVRKTREINQILGRSKSHHAA